MKRRIAVFAGGWGEEYLQEALAGIFRVTEQNRADAFAFVNYSVHTENPEQNAGEVNLFRVPVLDEFDGVILLANSFNCSQELNYLVGEIRRTQIPAVCVEYQIDGIARVISDNYAGMYELAMHLIKEHGISSPLMIGGPMDHLESQERIKAFRDAMHDSGMELPDADILYGNWSKLGLDELIDGWRKTREELPDAIVCANDIMAIAAINYLNRQGIRVPEDVLVTGYDNIKRARTRFPSVTSVNHGWSRMSARAAERLMDLIEGKEIPFETVVETRMVPGGTCGCQTVHTMMEIEELGRALVRNAIDPVEVDAHLMQFNNAVKKVKTKENVFFSLSYLFTHEHNIEGEDFAIYLDPEFFCVTDEPTRLRKYEVCDEYERIVALHEGQRKWIERVSRSDAVFQAARDNEGPGYYLFLPLHSEGYTYGFAMVSGPLNVANDNQHYIWCRHMIQALEHVRDNFLLEYVSEQMRKQAITDPLTGVFNRAGGESVTYQQMIQWTQEGGMSAVLLVDVDRMKRINDGFGHISGDLALRTVTRVLQEQLPEDFAVSRFGGDEFFVGGLLHKEDGDSCEALRRRVLDMIDSVETALAEERVKQALEFPLTISIGYALVAPEAAADIEKALRDADIDMYQRKQIHHQMTDGNE